MGKMLKFVIVEDSDIIADGLSTILRQINSGFRVLRMEPGGQLLSYLMAEKPDVLIVNPLLPEVGSPQKLRAHADLPDLVCVAFVDNLREQKHTEGFDETVSLFDTEEQIREKIEHLANRKGEEEESEKMLSQREKEIVALVVRGYTNKQIADELCISSHTVITHRRNISSKLQIHSSAGLTIYAIVNKLVKLEDIQGEA